MVRLDDVIRARKRFEELVQARIREAISLGLPEVARLVAKYLGNDEGGEYGGKYVLNITSDLVVRYDAYGGVVWVHYGGREVFKYDDTFKDSENRGVLLYIPGDWVKELLALREEAERVAEEHEVLRKLQALKEEAEEWGITLKDLGLEV